MGFLPTGYAESIAGAETWERSERVRDGEYLYEHISTKYEKTQKGMALIIEHRVVESKKTSDPKYAHIEPNPVGEKVSYFMPDYGDAAIMLRTNMKNYVCGLVGKDPKSIDEKKNPEAYREMVRTIEMVGGPKQIARGMLIKAKTYHTTKENGDDFLGLSWTCVPGENHPEAPSVSARRKALDEEMPSAASSAASAAPPIPGVEVKPWIADGWRAHPQSSTHFYRGQDLKTEADLVKMYQKS